MKSNSKVRKFALHALPHYENLKHRGENLRSMIHELFMGYLVVIPERMKQMTVCAGERVRNTKFKSKARLITLLKARILNRSMIVSGASLHLLVVATN